MNVNNFLSDYFSMFRAAIEPAGIYTRLAKLREKLLSIRNRGRKVMLTGNGASASIASHFALDFTKQGKVRSIAFNDASLITAYGNDFGYEKWVSRAVSHYGDRGDLAILISSSGRSPNIVNAAEQAREDGIEVVTLTGFESDNPLKQLGEINLWVDCRAYNIIETVHAFWLAVVCDMLIGKSEYSVTEDI